MNIFKPTKPNARPTNLRAYPRPFEGVNIAPEDLQRLFAEGKSEQEIAGLYGIKRKTLMRKMKIIRQILKLFSPTHSVIGGSYLEKRARLRRIMQD